MNELEAQLKDLIIERYGNLKKFTDEIDMPWTTLDSILKRGVLNSGVVNVIKICKALEISVDAIGEGRIEQITTTVKTESDNKIHTMDLTDEQINSVNAFVEIIKRTSDTNPDLLAANPRTENATQEEAQEKADELRKHVNKKKD